MEKCFCCGSQTNYLDEIIDNFHLNKHLYIVNKIKGHFHFIKDMDVLVLQKQKSIIRSTLLIRDKLNQKAYIVLSTIPLNRFTRVNITYRSLDLYFQDKKYDYKTMKIIYVNDYNRFSRFFATIALTSPKIKTFDRDNYRLKLQIIMDPINEIKKNIVYFIDYGFLFVLEMELGKIFRFFDLFTIQITDFLNYSLSEFLQMKFDIIMKKYKLFDYVFQTGYYLIELLK